MRRAVIIAVSLAASSAFAQGQVFGISLEISFKASAPLFAASSEVSSKASSEGSTKSSKPNDATRRAAECFEDKDCPADLTCQARACASPVVTPSQCVDDKDCASTLKCVWDAHGQGRCIVPPPPQLPVKEPPPQPQQLAPPSPPPDAPSSLPSDAPTSLLQRGSELYLRDRTVELREELALGRGPIIRTLAALRGVDAKALGRLMRLHRAELSALIGNGDWAGKFLRRVSTLS